MNYIFRFLNLTPKESFKPKKSATNFRITEDLFLSADETAEIDEADEELVATDLARVGAVPGAIDQIPFSYMDYLEGKGLINCEEVSIKQVGKPGPSKVILSRSSEGDVLAHYEQGGRKKLTFKAKKDMSIRQE